MRRSYLGFIFLIFISISCKEKDHHELLLTPFTDAYFEASGWEIGVPRHEGHYFYTRDSSEGQSAVLKISSNQFTTDRWVKKIPVQPYARYKITGYVKTIGIEGKNKAGGAGIQLDQLPLQGDRLFNGSMDWTVIETIVDTKNQDSFILELLLGKDGPAKGEVLFKDFTLEKIAQKELRPNIRIHPEIKKEPMSPLIFGQFIEMMGRSFYGGVWAEMLKDRKFFYVPGTKKSPWFTNADTTAIKIDKGHAFSKGDLPVFLLDKNHATKINQNGLVIRRDSTYKGRLVYKATGEISDLKISLSKENFQIQDSAKQSLENGYRTIYFQLIAKEDTKDAEFQVAFRGEGELTIAAVSLMPGNHIKGFRPDVLALMKKLRAPIYRWPGGNFVSGYHWKDGVGDPDKRPTKLEKAWGALEYNDVGIDEFMQLCDLLGTQANIAVNTGLGTAQMAAEQVEYVNGNPSTPMGAWRAKNGHRDPYRVKLWAVGNEMYGEWQLGNMPIEKYVQKHNRVAMAMKKVDPTIKLIGVGQVGDWNKYMYAYSSNYMDVISEHFYRQDWHAGGLMTHVMQIPNAIKEIAEEHYKLQSENPEWKRIKIAVDEWNYWYGPHIYGQLGTRYYLKDALGIAAGLNEFSRHTDLFYMANYAQTVNVIGAIKTTQSSSFMSATGKVLQAYRNHFGKWPIPISGAPEPLDISATLTEDGKLALSVINATPENYPLKLSVANTNISPQAMAIRIIGDGAESYNDENHPDRVSIVQDNLDILNNELIVPKESANIFLISLND